MTVSDTRYYTLFAMAPLPTWKIPLSNVWRSCTTIQTQRSEDKCEEPLYLIGRLANGTSCKWLQDNLHSCLDPRLAIHSRTEIPKGKGWLLLSRSAGVEIVFAWTKNSGFKKRSFIFAHKHPTCTTSCEN